MNWIELAEGKVQRWVSESEQQKEGFVRVERKYVAQARALF